MEDKQHDWPLYTILLSLLAGLAILFAEVARILWTTAPALW